MPPVLPPGAMTQAAHRPRMVALGTGGGTRGPWNLVDEFGNAIYFAQNSDIKVWRFSSTGVLAGLTEGVDYTLTGGPSAGSISLSGSVAALTTGEKVVAYRKQTISQTLDLLTAQAFPSADVETRFDIITRVLQELDDIASRAILLSLHELAGYTLPGTAARAPGGVQYLFGFDATSGVPKLISDSIYVATSASGGDMKRANNLNDVLSTSAARSNISAQLADATLTALSGILTASGKVPYATGVDTVSEADSTAFGRSLWNAATAQAERGLTVVGFAAHKNGVNQTGIASATATKVTFGVERYDIGNYFDGTKWTPPAGKVRIGAAVRLTTNVVAGALNYIGIYKNGSLARIAQFYAVVNGDVSLQISSTDDANGTDFYEIYVYGGGAGSKDLDGATIHSWFEGELL